MSFYQPEARTCSDCGVEVDPFYGDRRGDPWLCPLCRERWDERDREENE